MGSYSISEQASPLKHFCLSEVQQFQISVPVSVSVQLWTKPSPSLLTYQDVSFSLSDTGIGICPQNQVLVGFYLKKYLDILRLYCDTQYTVC